MATSIIKSTGNLIKFQRFTTEVSSIPARTGKTITINTDLAGYTPIGIVQLQNSQGSSVIINGYWWSGTTLNVFQRNIADGEISPYTLVTVAYAKTELISNS